MNLSNGDDVSSKFSTEDDSKTKVRGSGDLSMLEGQAYKQATNRVDVGNLDPLDVFRLLFGLSCNMNMFSQEFISDGIVTVCHR